MFFFFFVNHFVRRNKFCVIVLRPVEIETTTGRSGGSPPLFK